MRFAVISDLHYSNQDIQQSKPIAAFIGRVNQPDIDFACVTGDLTDGGNDGIVTCGCLAPFIGSNNSIVGGSMINQLGDFQSHFVQKISGKPLYMIQGNHDTYNGANRDPVGDYIARRQGAKHYMVVKEGVLLVFFDVYPDDSQRTWLMAELNTHDAFNKQTPIIFFTHYNFSGLYSDFWSELEKQTFYNMFKSANVIAVFEGHLHQSYTYKWNTWTIYNTAGTQYAIVSYNNNNNNINAQPNLQIGFAP